MIRSADTGDMEEILSIYDKARAFMRSHGNGGQWRNGFPRRELLEYDIELGRLYVLYDDFGLYGVFMMLVGDDPTYAEIREGSWLSDGEYAVLHRVASSGRRHGVLQEAVSFALGFSPHIRIDTHALNAPMQSALMKLGFRRCGIIVCDDGTDRVAFELVPVEAKPALE